VTVTARTSRTPRFPSCTGNPFGLSRRMVSAPITTDGIVETMSSSCAICFL
jgi:hypothetical protein